MRPRPERPILLIEDDEVVREAMAELLEMHGYGVVTAVDGEEALERLRNGLDPCLILLDIMMPRKDGWQFRREQLEEPLFEAIPTVAYSGDGTLERKAVVLGLPFYRKPVPPDTLLDVVERYALRD
jgi:two-component system, chemotaxis family, chemotaxis protein CheY